KSGLHFFHTKMEYSLYQTFLDKIKSHFRKGNGFR
ncbi:hypothetical protein DEM28_30000, partial [Enterobacter mori]